MKNDIFRFEISPYNWYKIRLYSQLMDISTWTTRLFKEYMDL